MTTGLFTTGTKCWNEKFWIVPRPTVNVVAVGAVWLIALQIELVTLAMFS